MNHKLYYFTIKDSDPTAKPQCHAWLGFKIKIIISLSIHNTYKLHSTHYSKEVTNKASYSEELPETTTVNWTFSL